MGIEEHACEQSHHDHAHDGTCDHVHEHNHGHSHEHGHEHDNSREVDISGIRVLIDGHIQDGASICTASATIPCSMDEADGKLRAILAGIAAWVEGQGGFVGHVKAALDQNGPIRMISMTDSQTTDFKEAPAVIDLNLAAIVFGVELGELQSEVERSLKSGL